MPQALIVDDDQAFTLAIAEYIEQAGFSVVTADSLEETRRLLCALTPDLLLVDLMLPDGNGLDLLTTLPSDLPTRIVVMTGHASLDSAIEAVRSARVVDFLVKPIDIERLKTCIRAVESVPQIVTKQASSPQAVQHSSTAFDALVGDSQPMQSLRQMLIKVAPTDATVLLMGESGTGKDVVARTIHQLSNRREHRYLALNCGAVSPQLIGTELFGHEKGSFTGASRQHKGHFERTSGGTLFLDEITEMPLELQVQLLRVLETGQVIRTGGDTEVPVDVRLIAATNRDPQVAIQDGKLREDLYFRLMVFPLQIPPLRERDGDVIRLIQYFLEEFNAQSGLNKRCTAEALAAMEAYSWPGNVRELRHAIQRAFILADDVIDRFHLPQLQRSPTDTVSASGSGVSPNSAGAFQLMVGTPIDDAERQLILATLQHFEQDKPRTAEALGISLKTLYNRLKRYGFE